MHYPAVWHSDFFDVLSLTIFSMRAAINYWLDANLSKLIACNPLRGEGL